MDLIASLRDLRNVFLLLVFQMIFFIMLSPPQDADMWWHLAAGKEMVEQGKILTTDVFSYTHQGEKWTNAFWLADILFFLTYRLGGYLGITLLVALTAVITMAVIYRRTSHNPFPLPLLILILATLAIAPVWTPRPQIFSFLLLAVVDDGLKGTNGLVRKQPWLLPIFFAVWANIHGGFIWGFLLIFAFIIGNGLDHLLKGENSLSSKALGQLSLWTFVAALAIGLNPNGLALWRLPFYTVNVSIQSITEWGSPDFHRLDLHPVLWLLFLVIVGAGTSRKALSWSDLLSVIGFAYMAFISQRSIGPFVIIATPFVINSLNDFGSECLSLTARIQRQRQTNLANARFVLFTNLFLLGTFVVLVIVRATSVSTEQQVRNGFPWKAVEWIRANQPDGRMFNAYNWGGYLQWELPAYPVFIDGRADLYGEETIHQWWNVVNAAEEGLVLLDLWHVEFVILEPGWPILERLTQQGWHTLYEDEVAIVLGR